MTKPVVTVVGLGPGGPEYVTDHTRAEIARVAARFLRTARHPSASLVPDATTFDEVYEQADTFDDVYAEITERLVAAATLHGEVLYAVPGSPLVLERTVRSLRADARVECRLHPAMSFLDLAWARLGVDPVEARVTLVDGHEFATAAAGLVGPLLVAHTHANWVLSDIKLAVEDATGDEPVVILQRLGTADEAVVHTTWADLDRTVEADHLTCVYVPSLGAPVGAELVRFHQLARTLREQCPWDQEQTHATLVRYLLEETYELVDALQALDPDDPATDEHLLEELGDVLYQIEFHATIAEQEGRFTMADVARNVHDKLVRRHPHVFGDVTAEDSDTVKANWDAIKREEKGRTSVFDGVAEAQPSLAYAEAVQRKAAKVGFDWPDVHGALPKIAEEAAELLDAAAGGDADHTADELGDLLFAVVNVARHLKVEPETALRAATRKFRTRFEAVEALARERDLDLHTAGLDALDALWDEVKRRG
ncbi:MAG: nucleoside triphosphate pyrophosphohydrolase [Acidimicrobiaceae bacterium]|nr:nucleoside triphosphate pyrophosphohydrolase [Acidimicrobiaceae bacterium]MCO5330469.1 nucleoside triphosphate pyrophosphohydrolase [Ilumatobacteraceae bacterium]